MPHIVIEYSQDSCPGSRAQQILDGAHLAVAGSGLFQVENIKSRLQPVSDYRLHGDFQGFVAVQCRIHPGRSSAQKQALSQSILQAIVPHCSNRTVVTVEVVEMDKASYAKSVI